MDGRGRERILQEEALLKSELHLGHPFAPIFKLVVWLGGSFRKLAWCHQEIGWQGDLAGALWPLFCSW